MYYIICVEREILGVFATVCAYCLLSGCYSFCIRNHSVYKQIYLFYGFKQKKNDKIIYVYECVCVSCSYNTFTENLNNAGVFNGSNFQSEIEMAYIK